MEGYLREVERNLLGMDRRVRRDIVEELRAHLADALRENPSGLAAAVAALGPPRRVALGYKQLYGYGTPFKVLVAVGAGGLSLLTLPALPLGDPPLELLSASLAFLGLLVLLVALVSIRAGKWVGALAGTAAAATRVGALALFALLLPEVAIVGGPLDVAGFVLASLILIPVGYLPGREREAWQGRGRGPP